jgi:hypothetical protein
MPVIFFLFVLYEYSRLHCKRACVCADVLRTAHGLSVMVSQASLVVDSSTKRVEIQLFLKNGVGCRPLAGEDMLRPLLHQLRKAILLPVAVSVTPTAKESCAAGFDVYVLALPDAAGRGRPRVTLAIATAVSKMGLRVETSFVGMVNEQAALGQLPSPQLKALATTLSLSLLQV